MLEKSHVAKVALFFLAIVVISYWPVFVGRVPLNTDDVTQFPPFLAYHNLSVRTPHAELGDAITEVYPWRKFAAEAVRSHVFPLWNPNLFAGIPFQANPLTALFYPFNLIFVFLPMPTAWSLSLMLKVFLAATFTFLFLRKIGASVAGAMAAGVAFALSGFMTAWLAWPRADTLMWLPLLCFQIHRLCWQPSPRSAVVLAGIIGLTIVSGHPGMIARTLAAAAAYGLWIVVFRNFANPLRQALWLAAGGLLGLGLAAIQIGPTIEWLGEVFRTLDMPGVALPWTQAIGFFSRDLSKQPNSAGVFIPEGAVYIGALPLLAVAYAFFRRGRKEVTFFAILFVVSFCTAYGLTPIYALSQKLPVFQGLRMDEALALADFSLAVLAGLGISYLETFKWKSSTKAVRAAVVGILLVTTALLHAGAALLSKMTQPGVDWWRSPRSFRVLLIAGAFLISLRLLRVLSHRQWAVCVVLLVGLDLVSFSYGHMPFNQREAIYPDAQLFRFLSQQPKPFRVVTVDNAASLNVEYVYGLATAGGYEYMLQRTSSLTDGLDGHPANGYSLAFAASEIVGASNRIVDLLNIKYLIATKFNGSDSQLRSRPERFREVWSDGNATVFENLKSLPRAFLVPQTNAETIAADNAQLARVKETSFDPGTRVILPSPLEPDNQQGTGPTEVLKYSEKLNSVHLQVSAATRSVLVLSQIYYPGWRVYVDGKAAQLLRPNYGLTGVAVEAGMHDVTFRYLPTSFIAGAIITLLSALLAVVVLMR